MYKRETVVFTGHCSRVYNQKNEVTYVYFIAQFYEHICTRIKDPQFFFLSQNICSHNQEDPLATDDEHVWNISPS